MNVTAAGEDRLGDLGELVVVEGDDGSQVVVALHGGHVVSWRARGREQLFLSTRATVENASAIRGGIPVCFPQFAGLGPLPKHGFARTATWEHLGGSRFVLSTGPTSWAGWPHACRLTLDVLLGPSTLTCVLTVENIGIDAFAFTGALHTYLSCDDVRNVSISGLDGCSVHAGGTVVGDIGFGDGVLDVDMSVLSAPGVAVASGLTQGDSQARTVCAQTGFPDVVVWNVGRELGARMSDLGDGEWKSYVCIEAATVHTPTVLERTQSWRGSQTLLAM